MEANKIIDRGDVFYADLGANTGSVQSGVRPVVVIQNNKGNQESPTVIAVPLTTQPKKMWMPVHVMVSSTEGLPEDSMAMCEQICTLDKKQLDSFVCHLSGFTMRKINVATLISIGLMPISRRNYIEGRSQMVMTLCAQHLQPYFDSPDYRVERLDHFQDKEICTCCHRSGYDYRITNVRDR